MSEFNLNYTDQLRTQFWEAPNESFLQRNCVAAAFYRSTRWLWEHEKLGTAPPHIQIGKLTLYKKEEVLKHWCLESRIVATSNSAEVPNE